MLKKEELKYQLVNKLITRIKNIKNIATWSVNENSIVFFPKKEIQISDGKIMKIDNSISDYDMEIDAQNLFVTPGFIDSHTHPIYIGNRAHEFSLRSQGLNYEDIIADGGGIVSSIDALRNASEDELFNHCYKKIESFLKYGTTTIEAKSGYGLSFDDEVKSLKVIKKINEKSKIDLIPTFLGAHDFPKEYNNKDEYVDLICNKMIPFISENQLAEYCDVFCEDGFFTLEQTRKIINCANGYGIKGRLHADELKYSSSAELAAELGVASADHLMEASDIGIKKMAENNVVATILPGTTLFLGKTKYANGRKMIDMGCDVSLASDYNPGTCTIQSLPFIMFLGMTYCGLTLDETFKAVTYSSSKALNIENNVGRIKENYFADLLFWDIDSINEIPYWMGNEKLKKVMKKGELVIENNIN